MPLSMEVIFGSLVVFAQCVSFLVEMVYNDYKIIVNGVVVIIGLFLCFLGKKTVKVPLEFSFNIV